MKKLILLFVIILSSCGIQREPAIKITHVLAITETQDTLQIPISAIRPNVYYNVTHYGIARPYIPHYYSQWHYNTPRPIYVRPNNSSGSTTNNNSGSGTNIVSPTLVKPPKPSVPSNPSGPSINKGINRN